MFLCWLVADIKRVAYKNSNNKLRVPVRRFNKLYSSTIKYHCKRQLFLLAQLPQAEKLIEWFGNRQKIHKEGLCVPDIVVKTWGSGWYLGPSGIIISTLILWILWNLSTGAIHVENEAVFYYIYSLTLSILGVLTTVLPLVALRLEQAAVEWVLTTALHALSPFELAFGVASGIRVHTYQQAKAGKEPDPTEEFWDTSSSIQQDGVFLYTRLFTADSDPLCGDGFPLPR